jgi:hypothetical protein
MASNHINLGNGVVGVLNSIGRGSGRTTRQMQALPHGGWFFHNSSQKHMEDIRKAINRPDIHLYNVQLLLDISRFRGVVIPGLLMDHHASENIPDLAMWNGYIELHDQIPNHPKVTTSVQKSTICPCGIHRLDCDYHK